MSLLQLDQLRVIPAGIPPHRQRPAVGSKHRLRMVELAVEEFPGLVVDDREVRRQGPCYTVDTLSELHTEYPEKIFCLLIGKDVFAGFERWREWQRILTLAHIVVMSRPDTSDQEQPTWAPEKYCGIEQLREKEFGCVLQVNTIVQSISATEIRRVLADGRSIDQWVSEAVRNYIEAERLYQ
jgi:nicotinate-nucleotide adenylyltransferase